jgi:uncharacterized protein YdhG (YjbR/CyaY superfamily)
MGDCKSVAEYIAAQPKPVRIALRRVRTTIRKALPGAEEKISYQIPAYFLNGRRVIYFAGWTQHYALYPCTRTVRQAFKDDLTRYAVRNATIRFPLEGPVPVELIARIAKFRAKEEMTWARAKPAKIIRR